LLQDEVFHLRDRTDDGLIGCSRLQRAAAVVQSGQSTQTFANSLYESDANPSGVLKIADKLSQEGFQYLVQRFR
jgi:phage portal protein BeeE